VAGGDAAGHAGGEFLRLAQRAFPRRAGARAGAVPLRRAGPFDPARGDRAPSRRGGRRGGVHLSRRRPRLQLRPARQLPRRQRATRLAAHTGLPRAPARRMTAAFVLDPRLQADSHAVVEWPLCDVRLMDDARWPWLLLVPRLPAAREIIDLDA